MFWKSTQPEFWHCKPYSKKPYFDISNCITGTVERWGLSAAYTRLTASHFEHTDTLEEAMQSFSHWFWL